MPDETPDETPDGTPDESPDESIDQPRGGVQGRDAVPSGPGEGAELGPMDEHALRAQVARQIVESARRQGIPIEDDPDILVGVAPLVEATPALSPHAYAALGGVLAFLDQVDREQSERGD